MAIVVEEEKRGGNIMGLLTWAIILITVGLAVYYVFFKRPEIVEQATPARFANIEQLLTLEIKPDDVLGNSTFKILQTYVKPLTPPPGGKENPFLGTF